MASPFRSRTSCRNVNEADDSALPARTTHSQSPAIGRKCQAGKPATLIGNAKPLASLGEIPKPGGPVVTARSQRLSVGREGEGADKVLVTGDLSNHRTAGEVPQPNHAVVVFIVGQSATVAREGNSEGLSGSMIRRQIRDLAACLHI